MRTIPGIIALTLMIALAGCQTFDRISGRNQSEPTASEETYEDVPVDEPGLKLSTEQRFADVPLPVSVREDLDKTFVYESSSLQIGRMVYTSRATVNELVSFYIRECPIAGWNLQNVVQADGAELLFTKPGKRLIVSVSTASVSRGLGRELTLTLVPEE